MAEPLVAELRDELDRSLRAVLGDARRVALVNFPNHGNAGDPAIWLGARASLRRLGVRVGYQSSWRTFDAGALQRAVPDGPVLLNGGGNLGDLYPGGQQGLRERLLAELVGRPIVQLPQSIHFEQPAGLSRFAGLLEGHGVVTLMVREEVSRGIAGRAFPTTRCVLAPDLAFGLGPWSRSGPPVHDVVWLLRADKEVVSRGPAPVGPQDRVVDWLDATTMPENRTSSGTRWLNRVLSDRVGRGGRTPAAAWRPLAATFTPMARGWVDAGMRSLGQGRVVVTDKLHGHLFALLLGIPHVVLDNSYGKVRATYDTWTHASPLVHWAGSFDEARATADRLLAEAGPR